MVLCMLVTAFPLYTSAAKEEIIPDSSAYPNFESATWEALYAHAIAGSSSTDSWQKWMKDYTGIYAEEGVRYFFLPKAADDNLIEIFNGYENDAVVGGTKIKSHTSAFVEYTEGEAISVTVGDTNTYTFKVFKSDAEASLYINDTTNSYIDAEGNTQETDLWNFLIQNKENYCSTATYSIVSEDGIEDGDLKKIKGRGNTNWKESDKKPFNINFNNMTTIGHTTSKKFSLVANPKDSTLLRNTIMYNLAHDVGNPYSSDQSFVDFFVNGEYRGSYIACQKIDLGKNAVVSLKDESEELERDFNFLVEVDVWNYKNDTYFKSKYGYHVVLKTPDLEDFETNTSAYTTRYNYIRDTYQKLENALYTGTLADIEAICDLESLASQYLLQDLGKNCDGGYTSTFFTYNASEKKFYAAPIWDCDSHLGAVDVKRDGTKTSTSDHTGWTTRLATYNNTINPLGRAFYVKGTSSAGETFKDICKRLWTEKFLPKIDVLLGKAEPAEGDKGMSIDDYAKSIEKTTYINYIMWDFMWLCQDKNSSLKDTFTDDVAGELDYMKTWLEKRTAWITNEYNNTTSEPDSEPGNNSDNNTPVTTRTIYFTTDLGWDDVHYYLWGHNSVNMKWPGEKAEKVGTTEYGSDLYKITINNRATKINFNNGAMGAQTASQDIPNTPTLFYTTDKSDRVNGANMPYYNVATMPYEEEEPTTTVPATTTPVVTEPVTTAPSTTEATAPTEPVATNPDDTMPTEPAPTKPVLPENTITAFVFDSTGKTPGDKLEEYGSKEEGYAATTGNGTLVASVNSDGYRALEWSDAEYGDDEISVPIVSAGSKNPWGEFPYVQVTLSTMGYKDIRISLTSAGSKKCPATWLLSYSTDGKIFTVIDGASFTIALEDRKSLINYFDNLPLPSETSDKETLTLRLFPTSTTTVNGGTTADDPTGGELVINNVIITGNPLSAQPSSKLGDADLNGSVNVKDATTIQKHIAGLITLSDSALDVCDTTRDSRITVSDATAIQKFVAGLIIEF